jgi:TetR/AcrR family transcriptional regulator
MNVSEFHKILAEGVERGEFNKDIDFNLVTCTLYGTKNFIMNAPQMASMMFGYDTQDEKNLEEKFKPRIKAYLKTLLKAYLVKNNND